MYNSIIVPIGNEQSANEQSAYLSRSFCFYSRLDSLTDSWVNASLLYIHDIWYDGVIIPFSEIKDKVGHNPSRLFERHAIRTAVRARATRLRVGPFSPPPPHPRRHRMLITDDDDEVMLNVLRCQLTY